VIALERKSALLIALLVLIVVALIFTLRRQLTSVRAAGLTLESMATNLDRAYKSAEAGNRAKSQFMATMGHEIRTPLNAILGMVELLELQDLPQDSISNLRTIRKSGEALLDIINEILDFAKIEHGMLELECRVIDVRACAENAAELMRSRAADTGNRILVELPDALLAPYVWSDPTRLRQIVLNLVSNAVKFTSKGVITLRLSETLVSDQLRLRVEVRDTGIGIDETGLAKLFQPFSQVDASISRKYGGTGLGLTICKEIVERFNGEIGVESTLGIGSTFWFEIPVKPSDIAPASVALPAEPTMPDLPILDILVVEDNLVNLQVATKFLEHLQQRVWGAANGSIGVEMACDRHFDVILMDMQMPVMDGIEAAALIRSGDGLSAKSPIFAMTANASEGDRQKCMEAGMDGFQSKPISIAQLRLLLSGIHPAERAAGTADRSLPLLLDTVASDPPSAFHIRKAEMVDALGEQEFHELLETFFDDASGILKELQSALEIGDTRATDRLLHALKGAAGNMGLAEIAATSDQMRGQRLDAGNVQTLAAELHAFHSKLVA
jgi:signal transduction histidine kinase/DNA-binding response OmpR family regulator